MSVESPKLTPMLKQYYEIKESVEDAILFFRMGDFFEIFGDDAEAIAPKLDIVLTARERGDQTKIPFCGVPHHSAKQYWIKLLKLGYKVAICEQLEDASEAKGLVKRGITRVYTPGSLDELEGLERDQPNYLLAWMDVPGHDDEVLAVIDVSTGEIKLGSIRKGDLTQFVKQFKPSELLVRRFMVNSVQTMLAPWMKENQLRLGFLPEAPMKDESLQRELLMSVFGSPEISTQPCGEVLAGGALVASVLVYLKSLHASTSQFLRVNPLSEKDSMALSETVLRDLEIFETSRRRQTEGSLAKVIDRTLTPMGSRAFRYALANPLIRAAAITERHSAIGALILAGDVKLQSIRNELKNTSDLARLSTRIITGSASPHELVLARAALAKANLISPMLLEVSDESQSALFQLSKNLVAAPEVLAILDHVMQEHPEGLGTGRGVFCPGYDLFLDEKNSLAISGEERVSEYEEKLRAETGISSLKIKSHKSYGLLIEVTKSNTSKVPDYFIRRQTMTNGERFTTIELKDLDDALAAANDLAIERGLVLYRELLAKIGLYTDGLMTVAKAIGELDMILGFAWLSLKDNYVRPVLTERPRRLTLKSCRHPVIEAFIGKHNFVSNDVLMNEGKSQILITGPNMAGKSTIMRQTAIAAILNQAGCWVPSFEAEMPIFDRIFTRVGASDDLSRGQSTFMVEMSEAAEILRKATSRSLVILDEVGRGTSTTDGLAIASSILEDLADRVHCFTMFATHYHELVSMMKSRSNIIAMQTEVLENDRGIVFTHRLKAGASASSFGIEVAKLAGVPSHVIDRAKEILTPLDEPQGMSVNTQTEDPKKTKEANQLSKVQKGLFGLTSDGEAMADTLSSSGNLTLIAAKLESIKIHKTTPLQALNLLNDLKMLMVPLKQRTLFDDEHRTQ